MSQLVQSQIYEYNDQDSGLTDTTYCPDTVIGDECPTDCWFDFAFGGGNTAVVGDYLAFTYQVNNICTDDDIDIQVTYDAFNVYGNIFSMYVDDVLTWQTACMTGTGSDYLTIPAGTRKVRFTVAGNCAGGSGDLWALTSVCL